MESRFTIAPLPPHRGRHAGLAALGLLGSATVVAWVTRTHDPTPDVVTPRRPAAATKKAPELVPIPLDDGVKLAAVEERAIPYVVTATGPVTYDESRTNHVGNPVPGVFVKTRPTSLGRTIRAGETVGVLYSLEVWVATTNLLAELRDFHSQEALDAERMRLLRWGMRREQLANIELSMQPTAALPVIARVTGKVVAEDQPGTTRMLVDLATPDLLTITDPTRASVWVELPAHDAVLLTDGGRAQVAIGNQRPVAAPIGYLATRARHGVHALRVDLHPYRAKMPPDATAKLELLRTTLRGAVIPQAAVVQRDKRTVAYVVKGEVAEPRDVQLGPTTGDSVLVVDGVAIGDRVVLPN